VKPFLLLRGAGYSQGERLQNALEVIQIGYWLLRSFAQLGQPRAAVPTRERVRTRLVAFFLQIFFRFQRGHAT
jgi:hypothetical protein